MLALQLLIRNWRSGELRLLSISIVLAVAVLSGIAIFTDRLESTLLGQSNALLGADAWVVSSKPMNPQWMKHANQAHLKQSHTIEFASMVYAGDEMHLAAIKAVEKNYPLRGQLKISQVPFAMDPKDIKFADAAPKQGEVWVDSRLLPQLNIKVGEKLVVGELELRVTQVLIRESESASLFASLAPKVLMSIDDVPATKMTQVGSNITYLWLFASDDTGAVDKFTAWLKPQLSKHEKIEDVSTSQERLSNTLKSSRNFLLFAAVIAVLLSGVAIAIAARQFSERHTNQVALMKSLGASAIKIRQLYLGQLFLLGSLASGLGLLLGVALEILVALNLQKNYSLEMQGGHFLPYVLSFLSGLICLIFFALPSLWFLPTIPPLKILRKELKVNGMRAWGQGLSAFLAILVLIAMFSQDLKLAASVSGALVVVALASYFSAWLLLLSSKYFANVLGGFGRLAFSNLQRRKGQSLVQIMVFSIAIMLLLTLTIVRTSLIDDWKSQVPVNSPNHFLLNVAPAELDDVKSMLSGEKILDAPLYPMVRGRLVQINGQAPSDELVKQSNALQREVNLTQSDILADDNKVLEGEWWDKWHKASLPGVSVEEGVAKSLHLKVGDSLRFSLGGLDLDVQVASIRSLSWKSMRPNFFFIFEPQSLDAFSPTYMTSIYLAPEQKLFINQLLRKHPTITVVELDRIIDQIRKIIDQVSDGIGLVLWLTLSAGSLVLFAAVLSSIDSRKQEAGLLRALGSSRQLILGSVLVEFLVLGLLAGVIATISAESLLFAMQTFIFKNPIQPHFIYWLIAPVGSALFISALGVLCCRPVMTTPPMVVLREAS
jgi:putative ABC transport system permease protein